MKGIRALMLHEGAFVYPCYYSFNNTCNSPSVDLYLFFVPPPPHHHHHHQNLVCKHPSTHPSTHMPSTTFVFMFINLSAKQFSCKGKKTEQLLLVFVYGVALIVFLLLHGLSVEWSYNFV
jgi:hypothetical protein